MTNKERSNDRASRTDRCCSRCEVSRANAIAISILVVVLIALQGCGASPNPPAVPIKASPTDYAKAESWEALPNASQSVDVFFVYPTTYTSSSTLGPVWTPEWNQSLAQAYEDSGIKTQITDKTGVFSEALTNLYVPYFQQASGLDVLNALLFSSTPQNADAANAAMQVA